MDNHKRQDEEVLLTGMLAEFREALRDEIKKIEKSGQSSTLLRGGRRIESNGSDFWYRFQVDYLPSVPSDAPCNLIAGKNKYNVTVVSFDESEIILACRSIIGYNFKKIGKVLRGRVKFPTGGTVRDLCLHWYDRKCRYG